MSFDLCILNTKSSITADEAKKIYEEAIEGEESIEPNYKIKSFVQDIVSRYPEIDNCADEDLDSCPWTNEFDVTEDSVLICIARSRVADVIDWIPEVALKHDLVCYDPQENKLRGVK